MPEEARQTGMPEDVCAGYLLDEVIAQDQEVFFPASYFPFRVPGFLTFVLNAFFPGTMEMIVANTYGQDFIPKLYPQNPFKASSS